MADVNTCPDPERLQALIAGALAVAEQDALSTHVEGCANCQQTLDQLAASSWEKKIKAFGPAEAARGSGLKEVMADAHASNPVEETQAEASGVASEVSAFLSSSATPGHIGRLGHYEIIELVGQGGFGLVFKAHDEVLDRVVAIKVLSPQLASNGAARKRFTRESKAAAAVTHEHVVGIHAIEEKNGLSYIVMQFIHGVSLQDRLDRGGALELKEVLRIGMQIAEGLAAAHKQGFFHRDIKPANILLENGVERVKITDFGLARAVDDASVTQSGTVAGTPMYMSPEQAEGLPIDHRSDLFSLGTVMYTMCTGHPPFRASGTHAVLKRVIDASPRPIREINNEIPDWLADIIAKLHAKKPEDRYQTAKEVAELLGQRLADVQAGRAIQRAGSVSDGSTPIACASGSSKPKRRMPLAGWVAVGLELCALCLVLLSLLFLRTILSSVLALAAVVLSVIAVTIGVMWVVAARQMQRLLPQQGGTEPPRSTRRPRRRLVFAALPLIALATFAATELTGVSRLTRSFLQAVQPPGTLIVEVDEPGVNFIVEGEGLALSHPGPRAVFSVPFGQYAVRVSKHGQIIGKDIAVVESGTQMVARPKLQTVTLTVADGSWIPLFNGKDLTGWKQQSINDNEPKVENGCLVLKGKCYVFPTAKPSYGDFTLRLEAKVNLPGLASIEFRYKSPVAASLRLCPSGFHGVSGRLISAKGPGDSKVHASPSKNLVTADTWSPIELTARGKQVTVKINGQTTADVWIDDLLKEGSIVLGSMGNIGPETVVHFRNIEIKELPPTPLPAPKLTVQEQEMVERINSERSKVGAAPLKVQTQLVLAARGHADDMARWRALTHAVEGKTPPERLKQTGYAFQQVAENIAIPQKDVQEAVDLWLTSPAHKQNLLNPQLVEVGVGVAHDDKGVRYCAVLFATPLVFQAPPEEPGGVQLASGKDLDNPLRFYHGNTIVGTVAFSTDGQFLFTGGNDGTLRSFRIDSGKKELSAFLRQDKKTCDIRRIVMLPDSKGILTYYQTEDTGFFHSWDMAAGNSVKLKTIQKLTPHALAVSSDGKRIAAGPHVLEDGKEILQLPDNLASPYCVAFSADGNRLAAGYADGTIHIWDLPSGKEIPGLKGHKEYISGLVFLPDGQHLISTCADGTARKWDVLNQKKVWQFRVTDFASSVALSPDGELAAISAAADGLPKGTISEKNGVWLVNTQNGKAVARLVDKMDRTTQVAFAPDGKSVAVANWDGNIRLWKLPADIANSTEEAG